jgi:hypothetical protein
MSAKQRLHAVLGGLGVLWVVGITSRYLDTVLKALEHPYNPGDEVIFVIVWTALAALILISLAFRPKAATAAWSAAIAIAAISMVVLSGAWKSAAIAVWISALAALIGSRLLAILGIQSNKSAAGQVALAFPLGFALLAFATLGLALLRALTPAAAWVMLVVLTMLECRSAMRTARQLWRGWITRQPVSATLESRALFLLTAAAFAVNLTWSLAPEVQFDALNYHLAVPKLYLDAGGLVDLPYFFHSYFAHLAEMVFALCMALDGALVAKLMLAVAGWVSAAAVYSLGEMLFSRRVGLWSAALFYLTPLTSWLTGSAHTDLIVSVYITGAVICFVRWYRSQRIAWIMAAGLMIGGGVGVKLNAAYAAAGIGLALLGLMVSSRQRFGVQIRTAAALVLAAACVALPWYLITYVHTGNPVFPMMNGIFKSPRTEPVNTMMNAAAFGIGTSGPAFLRLPFRLTLDTSRFGDALPPGTVGPMLLLFIPFGVLPLLRRTEARIVGAIAAIYFVLWAETFQYGRYYLVILPLITVLAVGGLEMATAGRLTAFVYHSALMLLLIQQFMILPIRYWNVRERFPVDRAFGLESSESFLSRALGGYGATALINRSINPGSRVLGIDTEYLRLYLNAPLESLAEAPLDRELRTLGDAEGGLPLARRISEMGFAFLVASHGSLKDPSGFYPYAKREFLAQFGRLVYSDEFVAVYRFAAVPAG